MAPTIAALSFWSSAEPDEETKASMAMEGEEPEDDYGYATTGVTLSEGFATLALPAPAPEQSMAPRRTASRSSSAGFPRWMREPEETSEKQDGPADPAFARHPVSDPARVQTPGQAGEKPYEEPGILQRGPVVQVAQGGQGYPSWIGERLAVQQAVVKDATQVKFGVHQSAWFALRSMSEPAAFPGDVQASLPPAMPPTVALFSGCGGVGKTMLAASLTRTLAADGERVLLLDMTPQDVLPLYFGANGTTDEPLRIFAPPAGTGSLPVHLFRPQKSHPLSEQKPADLWREIARRAQEFNRVIADLPTADPVALTTMAALGTILVVPITPDMHSVASLRLVRELVSATFARVGSQHSVFYLLTQYDPVQPLHGEIRNLFTRELGDSLLPFSIQRSAQVPEALAQAMTPLDYAPADGVAQDLQKLAGWLRATSVRVAAERTPIRWHER